jgi:uncharacterized membrane protein
MASPQKTVRSGDVLPSPELLREYNTIVPGAAERILAAFEQQAEHRRTMEAKDLEARIADTRRGQLYGLLIGLTAIVSGALTAIYGSALAGGFIGGGGVIGLVSVFVLGRYMGSHQQEPPKSH